MSFDILADALIHRLWPVHAEVALSAMVSLDRTSYIANAPWAAMGALLASVLLYLSGVCFRVLPARISTPAQQVRIEKMQAIAGIWLPYLLLLSPTMPGTALLIAAGFFQIRYWLAMLTVLGAEIMWRASALL